TQTYRLNQLWRNYLGMYHSLWHQCAGPEASRSVHEQLQSRFEHEQWLPLSLQAGHPNKKYMREFDNLGIRNPEGHPGIATFVVSENKQKNHGTDEHKAVGEIMLVELDDRKEHSADLLPLLHPEVSQHDRRHKRYMRHIFDLGCKTALDLGFTTVTY